ncbi:EAL domain-containing protein [Ferrimonas balearica]|uniref:EAL domain-containing protein n=1 Tax=Ferrimonas balearica TaxID=44012 RepID=UPI001C9972D9|nr:EAL domain-containing protein [Ferrimonas balearica]MBY5993142.1 EAL domain-containing protein [Ferrimonas balearica]
MKKTHEQTQRLISFWIASLSMVTLALLLSAWTASFSHANRNQDLAVSALSRVVEIQYERGVPLDQMTVWLPDMLKSYRARELQLLRGGDVVYQWRAAAEDRRPAVTYTRVLRSGNIMKVTLARPKLLLGFGLEEWVLIALGLVAALAVVVSGYLWLNREMAGVEILARRARRINSGDLDAAAHSLKGERPLSAGRALIKLHRLWRREREAKLELDRRIRANTFLDSELGLGNAMFFETRLTALAEAGEMEGQGVVCLIQFGGLEGLNIQSRVAVLRQFVDLCEPLLEEHADAVFARRHWLELALLVPMLPLKEAEGLAIRLQKISTRLELPQGADREELVHLGLAYFNQGDRPEQVMEEAEMALRAAQLQGHSNWFMYDKGAVDRELAQGTVRWRSLIENALARKALVTFYQPIRDQHGELLCQELFSRMQDPQGNLVRASLYRPMARRCGLTPRIERVLMELGLQQMRNSDNPIPFSINIAAESLLHPRFGKSVALLLANYQARRAQLILEFNERELVQFADQLAPVILELKRLGVQLSVDGVGHTVERTDYIDRFGVNWIKLHPSLVRQLPLRPENQLFITSLLQAASHAKVRVLAEGIEEEAEWQALKALGVHGGQGSWFGGAEAYDESASL